MQLLMYMYGISLLFNSWVVHCLSLGVSTSLLFNEAKRSRH